MTVNETLFYLAGRYLDLNKSCPFTLLCFAFLRSLLFFMHSFCINPADGWAGGRSQDSELDWQTRRRPSSELKL